MSPSRPLLLHSEQLNKIQSLSQIINNLNSKKKIQVPLSQSATTLQKNILPILGGEMEIEIFKPMERYSNLYDI